MAWRSDLLAPSQMGSGISSSPLASIVFARRTSRLTNSSRSWNLYAASPGPSRCCRLYVSRLLPVALPA